jgi:hypothetical protein
MSTRRRVTTGLVLASISAAAMLAEAAGAAAQPYPGYDQNPPPDYNQGPPPGYNAPPNDYYNGPRDVAPPQGQYAPPPPGAGEYYTPQDQSYDRDYAERYSEWAARYCIDRRNHNTAAGAVIGGVLGAIVGSGVAGDDDRFGGAVVGGALGATAGAAIGSSTSSTAGCPPGYYVRSGAPTFVFASGYSPYAPGWYNPWVWGGGHWVYRPYRAWYYNHPVYWRGGWHGHDRDDWRRGHDWRPYGH